MKKTSGDNMNIIENDPDAAAYDDYLGPADVSSVFIIIFIVVMMIVGIKYVFSWELPHQFNQVAWAL